MLTRRTIVTTACFLGAAMAVLADAPATRGRDRAAERIELAAAEHVRILTELEAQLPPAARAELATALEAASKGLETAHAALIRRAPATAATAKPNSGTPTAASTEKSGATNEADGIPTTTGVEKAREQVAASFATSASTLESVMARVPAQAAAKIQEALARIEQNRARALENLDRVIAMERPERPERPDRPERPERPDRPERPERPEPPEHPGPPGL